MKTFRQFLEQTDGTVLNAHNFNDRFKVGNVVFDNTNGLGATPNNVEVDYFGFCMMMKPEYFLRLCTKEDRREDAEVIEKKIRAGTSIGTPWLTIEFQTKDGFSAQVIGHEGRARTLAFGAINGWNTLMPVHVIPRGDLSRAKHFSEDVFKRFASEGIKPERSSTTIPLKVNTFLWNGETFTV